MNLIGDSRSNACEGQPDHVSGVAVRMNDIKTNAADAAVTPRSVDSIHSVRKLV